MVRNADGTTKLVQQNIAAPLPQPKPSTSDSKPTPQKVQIIRGADGKITYQGLNPGQHLIQMPDGKLHILTSRSAQNKPASAVVLKSGPAKTVTKISLAQQQQQEATVSNSPAVKTPVAIRQQQVTKQATPTVIVKSVAQKPTTQRV